MSEYQQYEFMTRDRPLTQAELEAFKALSSHIDASSTHALIEYHWGDFKHDPSLFSANVSMAFCIGPTGERQNWPPAFVKRLQERKFPLPEA